MRTLKFNVNKLNIERDPSCDFSGLVPGTEGYIRVEFEFSKVWENTVRVVAFYDGVKEYPAVLEDGKSCVIPPEVTKRQLFGIRVLGGREGFKITTDRIIIEQDGR